MSTARTRNRPPLAVAPPGRLAKVLDFPARPIPVTRTPNPPTFDATLDAEHFADAANAARALASRLDSAAWWAGRHRLTDAKRDELRDLAQAVLALNPGPTPS